MKINIGSGGVGVFTIIGAIAAQMQIPALVGWNGVGLSLLIGAGTSVGAGLAAIPGAIIGLAVFGVLGLLGGRKGAAVGLAVGATVGGIAGGIYGGFHGYDFSKNAVVAGLPAASATFNKAALGTSPERYGLTYVTPANKSAAAQLTPRPS